MSTVRCCLPCHDDPVGFFDDRCMVTGVSLRGVGAALVLLRRSEGSYFPISLAFFGESDRGGAIDVAEEDTNARLVTAYFADRAVLRDQNGEPYGELEGVQDL